MKIPRVALEVAENVASSVWPARTACELSGARLEGQADAVASGSVNAKKRDEESRRTESQRVSSGPGKTCSGACQGNGKEKRMPKM